MHKIHKTLCMSYEMPKILFAIYVVHHINNGHSSYNYIDIWGCSTVKSFILLISYCIGSCLYQYPLVSVSICVRICLYQYHLVSLRTCSSRHWYKCIPILDDTDTSTQIDTDTSRYLCKWKPMQAGKDTIRQ